jgi:hypothetical protein
LDKPVVQPFKSMALLAEIERRRWPRACSPNAARLWRGIDFDQSESHHWI